MQIDKLCSLIILRKYDCMHNLTLSDACLRDIAAQAMPAAALCQGKGALTWPKLLTLLNYIFT